ncbi:MAG: glutamate synthase [Eubacteriales bacterium]
MLEIDAKNMDFTELNEMLRQTEEKDIVIDNCLGQRYIGCAAKDITIKINGTPGNALGSYLNGAKLIVNGNAQDAVGDTMNDGEIIINGGAGDGIGLALRGGEIYVRDSVGYRAGVHMKQYKDKLPVLTIGGSAGSFLGEYLAGGYIIVLGLNTDRCPISNFCAAGMHGGKIFLRGKLPRRLPDKVEVKEANEDDIALIMPYIETYCEYFGVSKEDVLSSPFHVLTPDSKNPYHRLYVFN